MALAERLGSGTLVPRQRPAARTVASGPGGTDALLPLALSRPAEALARAGQVLAHRPSAADASIAHQAQAIVLRDAGRHRDAVAELRTALRLARTSNSGERVVDVLATLGATLALGGRTRAGLAVLDEAVALSAGPLVGRVLLRRASVLREAGRLADALADLRRAMAVLRSGGDPLWQARVHTHRFLVYVARGQAHRADRDLTEAERLFAEAGQELESAMMVHNRADVAFQAGDLPAALGYLDEAAGRYAELAAPMPHVVIDRCTVLLAAGLAAEALAAADEAIRAGVPGLAVKRGNMLLVAARAALAAGQPAVAVARASAARDLFRRQQRHWWQAQAAFVLLQARYSTGERSGRLRAQALTVADTLDAIGAREALDAHLLAGRLAGEQGLAATADEHLARAARFRHRGPAFERTVGWLAQALRAAAAGSTRSLLVACGRGLDAAEEHLHMLGATELRAYATRYGTELASLAQRHALARRDARALLWWSERWRASALAVPPAQPPDDRALAADLAALRTVMWRLDSGSPAGGPVVRLEQERIRLESAIRARTRRTAGPATTSRPLSASGRVGEIVDRLAGHRLIELIAVDDLLYAVVADERRVRLHQVGPVATAIRELELARFTLRRVAHGLAPDGALANLDAGGQRLQQALLGPAVVDLDERPVVVVPPGRLHAVPWSLLPALRSVPVRVAPSVATWLRATQARPPRQGRAVFIVGPGLDGTVTEVSTIASGYADPVVLSGGRATAERSLAALDDAWTAHIAAHGTFRADNPMFSALRLDDGPLTGYDLVRLRRAPHRLVLSSCESGVSAHVGGDELLGLASALIPLGTASLLASVVPVNDSATARLMVVFHEHLRRTESFPDALRAAQAAVREDPVAAATALSFVVLGC